MSTVVAVVIVGDGLGRTYLFCLPSPVSVSTYVEKITRACSYSIGVFFKGCFLRFIYIYIF